ncbi:MAG: dihydropteroate synthase [Acidiferrobacterales bacterium]|nr:dihydropteroate synthase [Acidiferrobacterales bacterium]
MKVNPIQTLLQRDQAVIMAVVNTTPDSFSDGGRCLNPYDAVEKALECVEQGADILDIGGESTRPGAAEVSEQEELDRVIPVIERLTNATNVPISIDTYKAQVMRDAVAAGASMINDVKALRGEQALETAVELQVPVCLMHMQGEASSMQDSPSYQNVTEEVADFLRNRIAKCEKLGLSKNSIVIDPGIGFGKTLDHNLQLLAAVPTLKEIGCEVLIGVSRKSMIDALLNRPVDQRLAASLGLAVQSVLNGAKIVRVHDIRATYDAVRSVEAVVSSS